MWRKFAQLATAALAFAVLCLPLCAVAAERAVPALSGRVIDQSDILSPEEEHALELRLKALEGEKGSQVVILIVPSTLPETPEEFAIRAGTEWKLGRKGIDDGVLFLIATEDRRMRLEVGYGLEGAIPDVIAKRIIADVVTPLFKQERFYQGVSDGLSMIERAIRGEQLPLPEPASTNDTLPFLFMALIFGSSLASVFRPSQSRSAIAGFTISFLIALLVSTIIPALLVGALSAFFASAQAASPSGQFVTGGRGWRRSGGFSGGFGSGGGGFSGGGGSFGGGGASGNW